MSNELSLFSQGLFGEIPLSCSYVCLQNEIATVLFGEREIERVIAAVRSVGVDFTAVECEYARNIDPTAEGAQRIDVTIKKQNGMGSCFRAKRDPIQEADSPA
jgi:hypothetical protein